MCTEYGAGDNPSRRAIGHEHHQPATKVLEFALQYWCPTKMACKPKSVVERPLLQRQTASLHISAKDTGLAHERALFEAVKGAADPLQVLGLDGCIRS